MKHTELHAVPEIEGLSFRGFRGEVDYSAMTTILDGSDVFDEIEQVNSLENIQRSYSHLTNCDPFRDMLFAEMSDEPIAYCRV